MAENDDTEKDSTYSYQAVDKSTERHGSAQVVKGVIEAKSQSHAIAKLQAKGLIPIKVVKGTGAVGLDRDITIPGMKKRPKLTDLAVMSRQLSTMVDAGLPLIKALGIVETQMSNKMLKDAIKDVRMDVEAGQSLADGLSKHEDVFPLLMIYMVKAGQEGGFLERALLSVADNFEADVKLRRQIKSAMAYPIVVLIVALIAVSAMLIFIVPTFASMFASMGGSLPPLTQFMVNLSHHMPAILGVSAVAVIVFTIWWRRNKNKDKVREVADKIKVKLPVFGELNKKIAVTRYARNLSTMMESAVPIIHALNIVGETSGNWLVEQASHRVATGLREGGDLGKTMATEPIFPVMLTQMVAAGDDSGATDVMLAKAADFYDSEVQATTAALTALLEPLMIVFLGGIIGTLVVALYLPTFSIFSQIQQSNNM
jgi:type IV pilus assembly protein PilC